MVCETVAFKTPRSNGIAHATRPPNLVTELFQEGSLSPPGFHYTQKPYGVRSGQPEGTLDQFIYDGPICAPFAMAQQLQLDRDF